MPATLSLLGLYNHDNSILSSTVFPLPEGLDHETLDPLLLTETAELELLYPNFETMCTVIKAWASARSSSWARMIAALDAEYNPIHNYDRTETWSEGREAANSRSGSQADQGTHTQQDTTSNQTTTSEDREETVDGDTTQAGTHSQQGTSSASVGRNVAGYNSAAADVPKAADSSSGTDSTSGTDNITGTEDRTTTTNTDGTSNSSGTHSVSGTDGNNRQWAENGTNAETVSRSGHVAGNIGVTRTQEMISEEIKLRALDIYKIIVNEFKTRFCLGVY